jgi:hypothetical protein
MKLTFTFLLVLATAAAGQQPSFRPLLPVGQVDATILQPAADPRFTALAMRLGQAAQADREWWTSHVRSAREGEPLPYDARMGISEIEYRQMLSLADSIVMQRGGTAILGVSTISNGWRLDGGTTFPEMTGIEIDTLALVVRTPFGELREFNVVPANDAQNVTGRWTGPQWKLAQLDSAGTTGVAVSFALGKLEANGRTLLLYDAKRARDGQIIERVFRLLELAPRK